MTPTTTTPDQTSAPPSNMIGFFDQPVDVRGWGRGGGGGGVGLGGWREGGGGWGGGGGGAGGEKK